MKIALVSGEYPPMEGGVGAFTQQLARALHAQHHEVHIITSKQAMPEDAGKRHRGRHAEPFDIGYASLYPQIERWRWPSIAKIADLTLRHEFDAVNIQYQAAAYNMNSAGINLLPWRLKHLARIVVTFHDLRTPYLFPKAGALRTKAISFMASQATGAIATNSADFDNLQKRVDTPLVSIPIGSNIDAYRPNHVEISEALEDLGLQEGDHLVGYFGFINQSKGADSLVHALAQLPPNYHLVFIGGQTGASDETNSEFVDQVHDLLEQYALTKRVHWTGFVSDARVSTFLEASDLVAMPYRDGASFRRGTLMATIAHGRPLITTYPQERVEELVQGENVWLVPPDDPEQLAEAIKSLIEEPELRRRLGEAGSELARQFSWDAIARQTATFIRSIKDPRMEGA